MAEREGVIRFDLRFTPTAAIDPPERAVLEGWRIVLRRLGLVGRDPARYEGYGFGNLSHRLPPLDAPPGARPFLVSGTQTGGEARLGPEGFSRVVSWDAAAHRLDAEGPVRPSSEATTHAAVYDADPAVGAVFHVHAPEPWRRAPELGLPVTRDGVEYGTSAMAEEVRRLFRDAQLGEIGVFAMAGHEDGLVAFGRDAGEAGERIVACLARASALADSE